MEGLSVHSSTMPSGSGYGSAFSNTPLITLKMAVFAPMPSASVSTATAVKPGFFSNWRKANLRSFMAQRLHRIDSRCTTRRQVAGGKDDQSHYCRDHQERLRIPRADFIQHVGQ